MSSNKLKAHTADKRTPESMGAGADGVWEFKADPVKGKRARKRAAAEAPKPKFANIDGKRVEVRQARPKEARPYPTAPTYARPSSRAAVAEMRGTTDPLIKPLPRRGIGPKLDIARPMSKAEQSNNLPFVPEFQAEGQPYPRMSRDKDGSAVIKVRTDNGMTEKLKGRGIARRADGEPTFTKRQRAMRDEYRVYAPAPMAADEYARVKDRARALLKDKIQAALKDERDALARGDVAAAEQARAQVRLFRKAARTKA